MPGADLVLVHGISGAGGTSRRQSVRSQSRRFGDIARHGQNLGVLDYEWVDGRGKSVANRLLSRFRKTAAPPDAVEIMPVDEGAIRESLACDSGRALWHQLFGCEAMGCDQHRSFVLMGKPRIQLQGNGSGQRLLWFGNGLEHLSRTEFIDHYTNCHGPLVAGYAKLTGLRSYLQVPDEQDDLCQKLRELGLGSAPSPAVFGQLVMGAPPLSLSVLRDSRTAGRKIADDEKRHINFENSMLLLVGNK